MAPDAEYSPAAQSSGMALDDGQAYPAGQTVQSPDEFEPAYENLSAAQATGLLETLAQ